MAMRGDIRKVKILESGLVVGSWSLDVKRKKPS